MAVDDHVRRRLEVWRAAAKATQGAVGQAAGHDQPWYSAYIATTHKAGLDELDGMAKFFGRSLSDLFDRQPNAEEDELLMRFRGITNPADRALLLSIARKYAPDGPPPPPARGRGRRTAG